MESPLPSPEQLASAEALAQAGYAQAGVKRDFTPLEHPKTVWGQNSGRGCFHLKGCPIALFEIYKHHKELAVEDAATKHQ